MFCCVIENIYCQNDYVTLSRNEGYTGKHYAMVYT